MQLRPRAPGSLAPGVAVAALLAIVAAPPLVGQTWAELQGRTVTGAVALQQSQLDATSDALVLLVASHPDDRYVLPAVWLRYRHGARVAVLLASRGGGGQNSLGPESGDALERIRTLETEAGCSRFDGAVYYLNRPDRGYRRTAAETFAEWGREESLAEMIRLLRQIRPDVVVTTHHAEETHGHDLALAELLPEAVAAAADPEVLSEAPPHRVRALFLGGTSTPSPDSVVLEADEFEPVRGATFRRLAYEILLRHHLSPGLPAPYDTVFEDRTRFVPVAHEGPLPRSLLDGTASLFDDGLFPGSSAERDALLELLRPPPPGTPRPELAARALQAVQRLERLDCAPGSDAARRRDRRLHAAQQIAVHAASIQVEVGARPGAAAVPGEELTLDVHVHVGGALPVERTAVRSAVGAAELEPIDGDSTAIPAGGMLHAVVTYRVPLSMHADADALDRRFRGDRFDPPVRLQFDLRVAGVDLPVQVDVPVDLRPPAELVVVPRMLLLPTSRGELRFTVKVERHSAQPVRGELDLRAPAGYRVEGPRTVVALDTIRADIFEFALHAPVDRRGGVDVVRIALGGNRVVLPVHKVEVTVDPGLRIGVVRSKDDALSSVIGAGGFGLHWAEISDIDLAVGQLEEFDTIVVDVRALRDRPEARQSFRRLLEFCRRPGKRLVVLYHKDTEFEPPGEGFRGAPFQPFQVGRGRVTRADAPVQVLLPDHCLLTRPNEIRPGDWDGWEQERGLYFPSVYAEQYDELLEMHDPGLPPERSALLYARSGDGEFVYCALALWRQLKKLHPGGVRLLANLLSPVPPGR